VVIRRGATRLPPLKFFNQLLHLPDFLQHFSGYFFSRTLGFQIGIVSKLPGLFLKDALYFVNLSAI
jgi:hypothetical protein